MSAKLIERARGQKAAAEQVVLKLREELERAESEVSKWDSFIATAESLESGLPPSEPKPAKGAEPSSHGHKHGDKVKVQKDSLAGMAAQQILLAKGPLPLNALVEKLKTMGAGAKTKDFPNAVNSALWRRRKDLFEKKGRAYHLRTQDIEFVD